MEILNSSFQVPISIKEAIDKIHKKQYFLPSIQREFVWEPEKITKLFDSLMRGYPIGSFLFWQVSKERIKDFQFYEFIRDFHERDNKHNPKANITGENEIISVLDGQQRLTALYIALKGTYSSKLYKKKAKNDKAYPKRKLYLNLLSESDDFDMKYDFHFLTEEEALKNDENTFWFEVSEILELNEPNEIIDLAHKLGVIQNRFATSCLSKLSDVISKRPIINYYLETSQELDKVLNIFIRVNSGGKILSYSDLLLSTAIAQWKTMDARDEINSLVDEINQIGDDFEFDKDFVLKGCLILSDISDIAFKVDNFNGKNIKTIEDKWPDIKKALRIAVELVSSYGYNFQTLTSTNAVVPIAYYILKLNSPENFVLSSRYQEDRANIKRWLTLSLLKRTFSGQPDNVLRPARKTIQEAQNGFPLAELIDKYRGTDKSLIFTDDDIENLLNTKYGQGPTFSILALLYPTLDFRNKFHLDHIFPKSLFTRSVLRKKGISDEDIDFFLENYNNLGNLQLLEGLPNEEKSNQEFEEWIEKNYKTNEQEKKEYMRKNYIPDISSLSFINFKEFFEKRTAILKAQLKQILI